MGFFQKLSKRSFLCITISVDIIYSFLGRILLNVVTAKFILWHHRYAVIALCASDRLSKQSSVSNECSRNGFEKYRVAPSPAVRMFHLMKEIWEGRNDEALLGIKKLDVLSHVEIAGKWEIKTFGIENIAHQSIAVVSVIFAVELLNAKNQVPIRNHSPTPPKYSSSHCCLFRRQFGPFEKENFGFVSIDEGPSGCRIFSHFLQQGIECKTIKLQTSMHPCRRWEGMPSKILSWHWGGARMHCYVQPYREGVRDLGVSRHSKIWSWDFRSGLWETNVWSRYLKALLILDFDQTVKVKMIFGTFSW